MYAIEAAPRSIGCSHTVVIGVVCTLVHTRYTPMIPDAYDPCRIAHPRCVALHHARCAYVVQPRARTLHARCIRACAIVCLIRPKRDRATRRHHLLTHERVRECAVRVARTVYRLTSSVYRRSGVLRRSSDCERLGSSSASDRVYPSFLATDIDRSHMHAVDAGGISTYR